MYTYTYTYFIERVGTVYTISNLLLNIKTDIGRKRLPNKSSPSGYVFFMIMSFFSIHLHLIVYVVWNVFLFYIK